MIKPRWSLSGYWPPILILLSVLVSCVLVLTGEANLLRLLAAFWLVTFIPGNAVVRLLQINDGIINLTLSIALSTALSICVSMLMVYTHTWSLAGGVLTLAFIALLASVFELNRVRNSQA
jgi:hypothetical protein